MAKGPGKYDEHCARVRKATGACGVLLIVAGGSRGSGFSVQSTMTEFQAQLPALLRFLADQIENDLPTL